MKIVEVRLKGVYIGTVEMSVREIRNAEKSGFTIISIN